MWIWILAGLVAVVALIFLVGSILPQDYGAHGTVRVGVRPDELWRKMLDVERHPMAASMARGVEILPQENGLTVWMENLGSSRVRCTTTEQVEHERLVREMADQVVPMTARVEFELEADGDGSLVHVDNRLRVSRGTWHVPVFRVMLTLFGGAKSGMVAYFRQIAGKDATFSWQAKP